MPAFRTLAILVSCTLSGFAQGGATHVYEKASAAVVLIKTEKGLGTGFLVTPNGKIVTAYHVIDGAAKIAIKFQSGDVFDDVALIAKDERRDVAILKVNGFAFPVVPLGNSNDVKLGDDIFVIGNPLGLEQLKTSISSGIVSGIRDLDSGYKTLQITAPISPGNSGGPAINASGEVIGVVVFKLTEGESLNFAVPINYARGLLESVDSAQVVKQWHNGAGEMGAIKSGESGSASRWRAVDTGSVYSLRFDGDYIYGEKEQAEEYRKLGVFRTFEVKKSGDKYSGTIHFSAVWWRIYNTEKIVTERCTFEFPIEISLLSRNRIEGRDMTPPQGSKTDKKRCTISAEPVWQTFALIPE